MFFVGGGAVPVVLLVVLSSQYHSVTNEYGFGTFDPTDYF